MSQVVVQNDRLKEKRQKTLAEEKGITKDLYFARFRKTSDATKTTMVERVIGLAVLPVAAFWGLLTTILSAGVAFSIGIFRILGSLFGGKKTGTDG